MIQNYQLANLNAEVAELRARVLELESALQEIASTRASEHGTTAMMLDRAIKIAETAINKE